MSKNEKKGIGIKKRRIEYKIDESDECESDDNSEILDEVGLNRRSKIK